MDMTCAKCGAPIERKEGAGRPPTYCGDTCKHLVEHEVRRIDRRIARYELELREELADRTPAAEAWVDALGRTRVQRLNDLRRWLRTDEGRLRLLLAGRADPTPSEPAK